MLKNFQNTIEFKNHCYVVKLPIKRMNELLPDNYPGEEAFGLFRKTIN